jgi:hypothetical protein
MLFLFGMRKNKTIGCGSWAKMSRVLPVSLDLLRSFFGGSESDCSFSTGLVAACKASLTWVYASCQTNPTWSSCKEFPDRVASKTLAARASDLVGWLTTGAGVPASGTYLTQETGKLGLKC